MQACLLTRVMHAAGKIGKVKFTKDPKTKEIMATVEQKLLPPHPEQTPTKTEQTPTKTEQTKKNITDLNQKKMDLEREIVDRTAELNQKKKSALGDPEKR